MKRYVIIVAAGSGSRMGSSLPKQFIDLAGKPVLAHSLEAFSDCTTVLALPAGYIDTWQELCLQHAIDIPHQVVAGGKTRFESVKLALEQIGNEGLVAVHDGVRPLIDAETIRRVFEAAARFGNAIPVVPLHDSVRLLREDGSSKPVNRDQYRQVQTPQCFDVKILKQAYAKPHNPAFTDDASVVEASGHAIHLVEGSPFNIKITTTADLAMAEALLDFKPEKH